jgi:hypothetical protein
MGWKRKKNTLHSLYNGSDQGSENSIEEKERATIWRALFFVAGMWSSSLTPDP